MGKTRPVRLVDPWTIGGGGLLRELLPLPPWVILTGRVIRWWVRHWLLSGVLGCFCGLWLWTRSAAVAAIIVGGVTVTIATVGIVVLVRLHGGTAWTILTGLRRRRQLLRLWPEVARAAKLSAGAGTDAPVAPLRRVEVTPTGGVRGLVQVGQVGKTMEHAAAGAAAMGAVMNCRQVPYVTPGDTLGVARVEFSWKDPLGRTLHLSDLPAPSRQGLPFALDAAGDPVSIELFTSLLIVGLAGAGKSGIVWALLASVRWLDLPIRLWIIDPKGGMELNSLRPYAYRYATRPEDIAATVTEASDEMQERQERLGNAGMRKFKPSVEDPLNILIVDEFLSLTMFMPTRLKPRVERALGLLVTQGRAPGYVGWFCSQGSQVDALGRVRTFIPQRICLATDSVDTTVAALGDSARHEARCDKIPLRTPGVGYMAVDGARGYTRFRSVWVTDPETLDIAAGRTPPALAGRLPISYGDDDLSENTALYRWYDAEERLLYVGISNNVAARTDQHDEHQEWWDLVASSTVEHFPTRDEAEDAERRAIVTERPVFNKTYNRGWRARRREYVPAAIGPVSDISDSDTSDGDTYDGVVNSDTDTDTDD